MKRLLLGFILTLSVLALLGATPPIRGAVISAANSIKIWFIDRKIAVFDWFSSYKNQAEQIRALNERLLDLERLNLERNALNVELNKILELFSSHVRLNLPRVYLARALSFTDLSNPRRMWLYAYTKDGERSAELSPNLKEGEIFGLVREGVAMGIATKINGRLVGYLNGDSKCSYGVYIGQKRTNGILTRDEKGGVSVHFIPTWLSVNVGDLVVTNGLDGIFPEGIAVGNVSEVHEDYGYLSVSVELDSNNLATDFMWLVDMELTNMKDFSQNFDEQLTFGGAFSNNSGGSAGSGSAGFGSAGNSAGGLNNGSANSISGNFGNKTKTEHPSSREE